MLRLWQTFSSSTIPQSLVEALIGSHIGEVSHTKGKFKILRIQYVSMYGN